MKRPPVALLCLAWHCARATLTAPNTGESDVFLDLNELKEQVILWNGYIDSFAGRLCGSERRIVKEYIGTLQGSAVGHSKALIKAQAETQTAQAALLECKREVDFFKGEKSIFKEYIDTLQSSAFGHRRALQHAQTETKTAQAETQEAKAELEQAKVESQEAKAELEKAKVESQIAKAELEKAKFKIERLDGALSYEQKRYRKKSKIQREEKLLA